MSENLIGMMKAPAFAGAFVYVGCVEAALVVGLTFILYGQIKYNHGIF